MQLVTEMMTLVGDDDFVPEVATQIGGRLGWLQTFHSTDIFVLTERSSPCSFSN